MKRGGMAKRQIFTVNTPLGYRANLSRDRWRQIVRFKHPALAGREKHVRECLESPATVRGSVKDVDVHLYYKRFDDVFLCVVTAPADDGDHFVVSAYLTKKLKKGDELWTK